MHHPTVAKTWKFLLGVPLLVGVAYLIFSGRGPEQVEGAISRYSSIEFEAGLGEDAVLRSHGVGPDDAITVRQATPAEAKSPKVKHARDLSEAVGVSPTCGCEATKANLWRGITFAAAETWLTRKGRSRFTEWLLQPSVPGAISIYDLDEHARVFPVDVYRHDADQELDPDRDLVGQYAATSLPVISTSTAEVHSVGDVPIGTWIPFPGSDVTLRHRNNPQFRGVEVELVERYASTIGSNRGSTAGYLQGYPLGEFLLPAGLRFLGGATEIPNVLEPAEDHEVTVIVPRESYGFRLASIPLNDAELARFHARAEEIPRVGTPLGELVDGPGWIGRHDGGRISVRIRDPLAGRAYKKVLSTVADTPKQTLRVSLLPDERLVATLKDGTELTTIPEFERREQTFEYPPMPPTGGINIFGEMRRLQLIDAVGAVTVGDREVALPTARDISINNITKLGTVDGHELVPFLSGPDSTGTQFDFSGVGDVKIDGKSQTSLRIRVMAALEKAAWTLGLLASIAGLAEVGRRLARSAPTDDTPRERRRSAAPRQRRKRTKR